MKKRLVILLICVSLIFTGCDTSFAKNEYNADASIAKIGDRYVETVASTNTTNDSCTFKASSFDGRETLWSGNVAEDKDVELQIQMTLSQGKAKLVAIDKDDHVTTIIECTPENDTEETVTKTVPLKSGRNRIKVVGYECKDIKVELMSCE